MLIYSFEPHGIQRLQSPPFLTDKIRKLLGLNRGLKTHTSWKINRIKRDRGKKANIILRALKRIKTSHPNIGIKVSRRPVSINGEDFFFGANEVFLLNVGKTLKKAGIKIQRIIPAPLVLYFFLKKSLRIRGKTQDFALIDVGFDHTVFMIERDGRLIIHTENYGVFHAIDKLAIVENIDLSLARRRWINGDPIFLPIIKDSLLRALEEEVRELRDFSELYLSGVTMNHDLKVNEFSPFNIYKNVLLSLRFREVFPAMESGEDNQNLLLLAGLWVLENHLLKFNPTKRRSYEQS